MFFVVIRPKTAVSLRVQCQPHIGPGVDLHRETVRLFSGLAAHNKTAYLKVSLQAFMAKHPVILESQKRPPNQCDRVVRADIFVYVLRVTKEFVS